MMVVEVFGDDDSAIGFLDNLDRGVDSAQNGTWLSNLWPFVNSVVLFNHSHLVRAGLSFETSKKNPYRQRGLLNKSQSTWE